jgi:endonuclease YncB( thermonuclease family)
MPHSRRIRAGPDRIRLRGIDTPELSEPEGQAANLRLPELLRNGIVCIVPRRCDGSDRLIADVFVNGSTDSMVTIESGSCSR